MYLANLFNSRDIEMCVEKVRIVQGFIGCQMSGNTALTVAL